MAIDLIYRKVKDFVYKGKMFKGATIGSDILMGSLGAEASTG